MMNKITYSEQETFLLGKKIAKLLNPSDVILLEGDLGAGKTTFTKGLAEDLGIKETVNSPTFNIIKEYTSGRLPLYHIDAYRLEYGGAEELGLEEYFFGDGVTVIEWSEFIKDLLPEHFLKISFKYIDNQQRSLTFFADDEHYQSIVKILN